jgi:hypothetical protein
MEFDQEKTPLSRKTSESYPVTSSIHADTDFVILPHLFEAVRKAGINADPISITNLFVALKSKPMAILVGPIHTGKISVLKSIAQGLIDNDPLRFQTMVGHPWWANRTENVAQFIEAQTLWNTSKIIDLVMEAGQPENANKLFVACMTRISPSELNEFFTGMAYQLRRGQVMRVGPVHYDEPIHFPRNVRLVGTMDENQFKWLNEDLLSNVSILHWNPIHQVLESPNIPATESFDYEKAFLNSGIREVQAALGKLRYILNREREPFLPLMKVSKTLRDYKIDLPSTLYSEIMAYLANSWSYQNIGLFNRATGRNLNIAMDFTLTQSFLLPLGEKLAESRRLCKQLLTILNDQFPRSATFVENFT